MDAAKSLIAAFSEDHVERLTGITASQLRYWDRTNLYKPSFSEENRRLPFSRVYSFKDIVSLRVLNVLRNQYSVPLQHLRLVSKKLSHLADDRWTKTRLYVLNKKVVWYEAGEEKPQEILSQQYVIGMVLEAIISDTRKDIAELNKRNDKHIGKIEQHRYVNHNAPVISGTRIPVKAIKNFDRAGYSIEQIISEYPGLTENDVSAALSYNDKRQAA